MRPDGPAEDRPADRIYWRSLEQLAGDPELRRYAEREFPEGASELPRGISRRSMLTLLGASLSLAGLSACRRPIEEIVPFVNAPEEEIPGRPRHYATTMPFGHAAYGLVVESHEGRPTKIEGNPRHPSTRGAASLLIQAAILDLYDPDRSRTVLHAGQPAAWPDFVQAWSGLRGTLIQKQGEGLAVLTESFASPTLSRLEGELMAALPRARWVTYEPVGDENVHEGVRAASGQALQPVLRLDRARVVLSLDADLLLTETDALANARGFADGRRLRTGSDTMSRLYAVESAYTVTGAMADHRLRLRSGDVAALLAPLVEALRSRGLPLEAPPALPGPAIPGLDRRWLEVAAKDLLASRGAGLIVAGRGQPPAVHAAVLALNAALGNVGETVAYHEPKDAALPSREGLADLADAMRGGAVDVLLVLGGNPVYDAPADLEFGSAMAKVAHSVHLGHGVDETSRSTEWHLPRAHFLESWGDARAIDGTLSVVQPLIAPLFGGRSAAEVLSLAASGEERTGHDLVRRTWQDLLGTVEFERSWRRVLHDGLLEGSATSPIVPAVRKGVLADLAGAFPGEGSGAGGSDLEIVFVPSRTVHDGRYANNGWLQELPDPITRLTWDNAALMSPATARALGVASEDAVKLRLRDREMEIPAFVVPGHADGTVAVALGYGRSAAGRIGNGVGSRAYALRTSRAPYFERGLRVSATGARFPLAQTQHHGTMEGRPIVREATLGEYRRNPRFASEAVEVPKVGSLWKEHDYGEGYQWGMTIDLNACVGCNACAIACQSENNVPIVGKEQVRRGREMHWIRIDRYFAGGEEAPEMAFQPVPCMQCENAPCESVCPVAATVHDPEGLNAMVYNRCIGTRYCSNNCPYKVRRFNFFNYTKDTPEILKLAQNPDVTVRSRGVMEKCTYCVQRINAAKIDAKAAGRRLVDGDVRTACQQSCPTNAIEFGNILDPKSKVAEMKARDRGYSLLEELYTRPRTTYLARIRNPHPELSET